MYTAEMTFKRRGRGRPAEGEAEPVWEFVGALRHNGQIIDRDYVIYAVRGGYKAIVGLPEETSLRASRFSKHVRQKLRALTESGLSLAGSRVLGVDEDSGDTCDCRRPASLILETNFLSTAPPLLCGKCYTHVPLYRIPHTTDYGTYEDILRWAWQYRAMDTLFIASGALEMSAYRQLARHDSELSKDGRELCRDIEKKSGIPTYFSLYRHYARSVASERKRPCPSCGKKWLLPEPWFDRYDFRCDRCRLVSNIGWDVRSR